MRQVSWAGDSVRLKLSMRSWFQSHWETLRTNDWVLPAIMAAAAMAFALLTPESDRVVQYHKSGA